MVLKKKNVLIRIEIDLGMRFNGASINTLTYGCGYVPQAYTNGFAAEQMAINDMQVSHPWPAVIAIHYPPIQFYSAPRKRMHIRFWFSNALIVSLSRMHRVFVCI